MEILTREEVVAWIRIDEDDPLLDGLIQTAQDIAEGAINGLEEKMKSVKFQRKLKLFTLNLIADLYDHRGVTSDMEDKMQYINATLLRQLQLGTYTELDA